MWTVCHRNTCNGGRNNERRQKQEEAKGRRKQNETKRAKQARKAKEERKTGQITSVLRGARPVPMRVIGRARSEKRKESKEEGEQSNGRRNRAETKEPITLTSKLQGRTNAANSSGPSPCHKTSELAMAIP